jgi:hypothetical protein
MAEEDGVSNMAAVAERLRLVRAARRKFLRLWAIEQAMVEPLLDRVAADLGTSDDAAPVAPVHDSRPQADKG